MTRDNDNMTVLEMVAAKQRRSLVRDWIVGALLAVGVAFTAVQINQASGVAAKAVDTPAPVQLAALEINIVQ